MKALILAAGYATRLYPLTKEYPKPLLEVKGRPIINYIVDKLSAVSAIDEIYVVTNSKFISFFREWVKSVKSSKKITLVDDLTKNNEDRLGAIGDINFVIKNKKIRKDLLIVGGDNLFSGSLKEFLDAARKNIPIAVFCLNNFLYGMTGGQAGPTTPTNSKTSTTTEGNADTPFDLVKLVLGAGAKYVNRYPTVYPHLLIKGIKNILSADGFRFMEIISQCPRQYGQRNQMNWASKMLLWQKEHLISKEKTKSLDDKTLKDKTIFGEFQSLKEYLEILREG